MDASLWYVNAVQEYLDAPGRGKGANAALEDQHILQETVTKILEGYSKGTRFGIHVDSDGLVAAGESGVQLTWMDAKVGDWVVTPRMGKPRKFCVGRRVSLLCLSTSDKSEASSMETNEARSLRESIERFMRPVCSGAI